MKDGSHSKFIENIMKRYNLDALDEVEKMELECMFKQIVTRGIALDINSYTKQYLADRVKQDGSHIVSYEADLIYTESKVADMQQNVMFHESALKDLKSQYTATSDLIEKKDIYSQIQEIEKVLSTYRNQLHSLFDLRNKIRKEVDKKKLLDLEVQEKQSKSNIRDIDFEVLENE